MMPNCVMFLGNFILPGVCCHLMEYLAGLNVFWGFPIREPPQGSSKHPGYASLGEGKDELGLRERLLRMGKLHELEFLLVKVLGRSFRATTTSYDLIMICLPAP